MKTIVKVYMTVLLLCFSYFLVPAQSWEQVADLPFVRNHVVSFSHNGKGYALTGWNVSDNPELNPEGREGEKDVWEYDPDTDTWTQLDDYPGPYRGGAIGKYLDGLFYFGFGITDDSNGNSTYQTDLWVFDPEAGTFTELPSCPCTPRWHPALEGADGKLFMGSGTALNSDLKDWWEYDIQSQTWTQKQDIPGDIRHHPYHFTIDGQIYVGGGHVNVWAKYDPATETWETIDNAPGGRVAGTQFDYNGKGYALSGDVAMHTPLPEDSEFMEYDPSTDSWTNLPPHPHRSRWAPSSFVIDGYVYLFGGHHNNDDATFSYTHDHEVWRYLLPSPATAVSHTERELAEISLHPNPTTGHIKIQTKGEINIQSCQVLDQQGRLVTSIQYKGGTAPTVDLSTFSPSVYFLKILSGNHCITKRAVRM